MTGETDSDVEKANAKLIFFPVAAALSETWGIKTVVGIEWILDVRNTDKSIGSRSDQLASLFGLDFANNKSSLSLIPLVQHFASYNGDADTSHP